MEALQLPEVLDGSKWIAMSLPGGRVLPSQTLGVDAVRGKMYWCDGIYEPRAMCPSHFGTEAALTLQQLLGYCTLVDAAKTPD